MQSLQICEKQKSLTLACEKHVKNMRACIVLEITMSCTGICLTYVLVQVYVMHGWRAVGRHGSVVGVDLLCGTSALLA